MNAPTDAQVKAAGLAYYAALVDRPEREAMRAALIAAEAAATSQGVKPVPTKEIVDAIAVFVFSLRDLGLERPKAIVITKPDSWKLEMMLGEYTRGFWARHRSDEGSLMPRILGVEIRSE